jgi:MATE efflux family protein
LLYLLPCLLLFPNWWGLEGIWISMPVSDALAFITAVISLMIYIKKVSKQHPVVAE